MFTVVYNYLYTIFLLRYQGVRFDPDISQTLRLEFAKSNTKVTKPVNKQSVLTSGVPFYPREAIRKCSQFIYHQLNEEKHKK